ncbi:MULTISPECIES: hypothetical protein [unclassified Microbacterium]|uniref:hypothetical protein n=1 Tax=unclassified Microbacterium TaxID=2609290 RepID=UPI00301B5F8D
MAFGFAISAIVLSSWLVQLMRAVYRNDPGFRRGLANATPLWATGLAGVGILFVSGDWLVNWVDTCFPADGWRGPGTAFIGFGVTVASVAAGRLIYNRVRVGRASKLTEDSIETSPPHSSAPAVTTERRPRNLSLERRRVIIEFALTYGASIVIILFGVGLA